MRTDSPIRGRDVSFRNYIDRRIRSDSVHMEGHGVPDYAYDLDYELRKKLDAIPHFYSVASKICATYASRELRKYNKHAMAVTPTQFPEIYNIGCDCARILGIGIPNIYVMSSPEINAFAIAGPDSEPLIILYSALVERLTEGELRSIIGHECGHIHNQHSIYMMLVNIISQMGAGALRGISWYVAQALTQSTMILLNAWSRAAEVTCDRAGMICCGSKEDSCGALAKLSYGAMFGEHEIDYEEIRRQLELQKNNITEIDEIIDPNSTHPTFARRIFAAMEFENCETLYKWRPELKEHGMKVNSKEETDKRCREIVNVSLGKEEKS